MFSKLVLFSFYLNCVLCTVTHYKASVVDVSETEVAIEQYESLILEAAAAVVKIISKAAKSTGIYVVAPIYEKIRCHYEDEGVFNNMVFARDGGIIAATPVSVTSKCNATESNFVKFITDFNVTFALVTEEDIVLHRIEYFDGIKNFIVFGFASDIPQVFAEQFTSSWSFVNNVNIISSRGLLGANKDIMDNLMVAEFQKSGASSSLVTISPAHEGFHNLHQNTKPLNMEAVKQGYTETICDGSLCCNFYVKVSDKAPSVHYALSAHSDVISVGQQTVALQACVVSSNQRTDVKFDKITITANFTKDSTQFPSVSTMEPAVVNNLMLKNNFAELYDTNVLTFGVISRDYSNDNGIESKNITNIHTAYISYENINDFFDYLWIRVRFLIFIVSIYILEML